MLHLNMKNKHKTYKINNLIHNISFDFNDLIRQHYEKELQVSFNIILYRKINSNMKVLSVIVIIIILLSLIVHSNLQDVNIYFSCQMENIFYFAMHA